MAVRDLIGKRGEAIVTARLMDFCGNPDPWYVGFILKNTTWECQLQE